MSESGITLNQFKLNGNIPGRILYIVLFALLSMVCAIASAAEKPRLFVLTDIGGDPDDQMSMVRLMTYANHIDIEGLAATEVNGKVNPEHIRRIIEAYGKVRNNLELHESGFPSAEDLRKCITQGLPIDHMDAVGKGKDSPGSKALIRAVDSDDPRPLWVTVWGDRICLPKRFGRSERRDLQRDWPNSSPSSEFTLSPIKIIAALGYAKSFRNFSTL